MQVISFLALNSFLKGFMIDYNSALSTFTIFECISSSVGVDLPCSSERNDRDHEMQIDDRKLVVTCYLMCFC